MIVVEIFVNIYQGVSTHRKNWWIERPMSKEVFAVEILQLWAKFQTVMGLCSRFIGSQIPVTTGGFELRISSIQNSYLIPQAIRSKWPSGLGNYIICKRFADQTLLCSLEFVIQINLEHGTIKTFADSLAQLLLPNFPVISQIE